MEDEKSRSLFDAVFDATGVGAGIKFLDIGCGSGLACTIAADRGANVCGLDASPGLLAIASNAYPQGDFRAGDMAFTCQSNAAQCQDNSFANYY
jgi:cyclopropane fatty-acyl-phospholipid synthase-like methyltransferase